MEKRKEINDNVVKWILNKVRTEYANDVSLVLIYGSYVNGTANSKSDVDCYYIPKSENGYNLAVDFIIEGVGYDIFPISWESVEKIADLLEGLSPLVGDANIIYSNSAKDVERFQAMQAKLKSNLLNDKYVKEIAAKRCEEAGRLCTMLNQNHSTSEVRKIAGNIIMTLADAVAVYNHDYYHFGLKKQFEDLQNNIPNVPRNIVDGYQNVVKAIDIGDVTKYAMKLFEDVCTYLDVTFTLQEIPGHQSQTVNKVDASWLASLYEEISSTFNKIYVCCETGNYILAFLSAVCLQRDLDDAKEAGCPTYELLSNFNYKELYKLSETTQKIERDLVQLVEDHGGHIKQYESFEQFELAKL
ncbi:MAG: nucleotidyltransferase domain-containing protein [Lachnospiraceae bacterium]|nr:nucleotidyltransferase domain-containing protein [Lachnospiraceae bacterium]